MNLIWVIKIDINEAEQTISWKCRLLNYKYWAKEIFNIVKHFEVSYQKVPNIMLANEATFKLIDSTSPHKVKGLIGTNYKLKFCVDNNLKTNEYRLIYDEQAVITS